MHAPALHRGEFIVGGIVALLVFFKSVFFAVFGVTLSAAVFLAILAGCGLLMTRDRAVFVPYLIVVAYSGVLIMTLFGSPYLAWLLLMIVVVIVTDVAGYFAGRMIGGRKFWPAVSPKKTWSGVVAGWIASAAVGVAAAFAIGTGFAGVLICVAMSFGAQMGDIAESAIKRRAGVKDSSNLIPGHGGFLDRFDGMIGASVVFFLVFLIGIAV
jgi:phosphatidate cytidylyltransferase